MLLHIKLVVCYCKVNHSTNIACIKLRINFLEPYENIHHTEENCVPYGPFTDYMCTVFMNSEIF